MNRHNLFAQLVISMSVLLLLGACGASLSTPTPIPTTATPTPIPPTSTLIPTLTSLSAPKAGHWEGNKPLVSFDIASNGEISNFKMAVDLTSGKCTVNLDLITVEADNTFVITRFAPYETLFSNLTDAEKEYVKANTVPPTPIKTDAGEMYTTVDIKGNFNSSIALSGTFAIMRCEDWIFYAGYKPENWKAEWKGP